MALSISFLCVIVVMWGYILHSDLNAIRRDIVRKNEKDGDGTEAALKGEREKERGKMYEELIEELRRPHADCNPWALMDQAADAIEELSKERIGVWITPRKNYCKCSVCGTGFHHSVGAELDNYCADNLEWCDGMYNTHYGTALERMRERRWGNAPTIIPASEEGANAEKDTEPWLCLSCRHYPPSSTDGKPCSQCNPSEVWHSYYDPAEEE